MVISLLAAIHAFSGFVLALEDPILPPESRLGGMTRQRDPRATLVAKDRVRDLGLAQGMEVMAWGKALEGVNSEYRGGVAVAVHVTVTVCTFVCPMSDPSEVPLLSLWCAVADQTQSKPVWPSPTSKPPWSPSISPRSSLSSNQRSTSSHPLHPSFARSKPKSNRRNTTRSPFCRSRRVWGPRGDYRGAIGACGERRVWRE